MKEAKRDTVVSTGDVMFTFMFSLLTQNTDKKQSYIQKNVILPILRWTLLYSHHSVTHELLRKGL